MTTSTRNWRRNDFEDRGANADFDSDSVSDANIDADDVDFFSRADDNLEYNGLDFDGKTENSEFRGGKGERYRWKDLIIDTESLKS